METAPCLQISFQTLKYHCSWIIVQLLARFRCRNRIEWLRQLKKCLLRLSLTSFWASWRKGFANIQCVNRQSILPVPASVLFVDEGVLMSFSTRFLQQEWQWTELCHVPLLGNQPGSLPYFPCCEEAIQYSQTLWLGCLQGGFKILALQGMSRCSSRGASTSECACKTAGLVWCCSSRE